VPSRELGGAPPLAMRDEGGGSRCRAARRASRRSARAGAAGALLVLPARQQRGISAGSFLPVASSVATSAPRAWRTPLRSAVLWPGGWPVPSTRRRGCAAPANSTRSGVFRHCWASVDEQDLEVDAPFQAAWISRPAGQRCRPRCAPGSRRSVRVGSGLLRRRGHSSRPEDNDSSAGAFYLFGGERFARAKSPARRCAASRQGSVSARRRAPGETANLENAP